MKKEDFITRCKEKHPNKIISLEDCLFVDMNTLITFQCSKCLYQYQRKPKDMLRKETHGCGVCFGGVRDTKQSFIAKARLKNLDLLFKYDLVEYINSITKIKIVCLEKNHVFEMTPSHHLNGDGCPTCAGRNRTLEDIKNESIEKFSIEFDFSKAIFVNMHSPIIIICPNGHEFTTSPDIHLRNDSKGGCIICSHINTGIANSYSSKEWIDKAKQKHNNYYSYDKTDYNGSNNKVIIICPAHGEFIQNPIVHMSGRGCNLCGIERSAEAKIYNETDFDRIKQDASIIHSNKYLYTGLSRDKGRLFINGTCDKQHIVKQRLDHHLKGHGCEICVNKTEVKLYQWLQKKIPTVVKQYKAKWCVNISTGRELPYDFMIPDMKVIIELDGRQHFEHVLHWGNNVVEGIARDIFKMKKANEAGYKIIRLFQEDVYQNDEDWLNNNILSEITGSDRTDIFISSNDTLYDNHIKAIENGDNFSSLGSDSSEEEMNKDI